MKNETNSADDSDFPHSSQVAPDFTVDSPQAIIKYPAQKPAIYGDELPGKRCKAQFSTDKQRFAMPYRLLSEKRDEAAGS